MIEKERAGENKGGVGFAEVEFDSPTLGEVAGRYMVRTLIDFSRVEEIVCLRLTYAGSRIDCEGHRSRASLHSLPSVEARPNCRRGLPALLR